jgi:hypothetical protein
LAPITDLVTGLELPAPSVFNDTVDTDLTGADFDFCLDPILHGIGQLQKLPKSNWVAFNLDDCVSMSIGAPIKYS